MKNLKKHPDITIIDAGEPVIIECGNPISANHPLSHVATANEMYVINVGDVEYVEPALTEHNAIVFKKPSNSTFRPTTTVVDASGTQDPATTVTPTESKSAQDQLIETFCAPPGVSDSCSQYEAPVEAIQSIHEIQQMLDNEKTMIPPHNQKMDSQEHKSQLRTERYDPSESADDLFWRLLSLAEWAVSGQILWNFTDTDGLWRALLTPEDMSKAANRLNVTCIGEKTKLLRSRFIAEHSLETRFFHLSRKPEIISFRDGIVDVQTGGKRKRELNDYIGYRLSMTYDKVLTAQNLDKFTDLVMQAAGSAEAVDRLQEVCGVALSATPARFLLFIQSSNLRLASAFVNLLGSAVDNEFVLHLSLKDYQRGFATAQTIGKHLLLSPKEGEAIVKDLETALRLIDGDGINADRKYQEAIDFKADTTIVCAGKQLPNIQYAPIHEVSDFVVRVILDGSLTLADIERLKNMHVEFVAWSMQGLHRYLNQGDFTEQPSSDLKGDRSSIYEFIETQVEVTPNSSCASRRLLRRYRESCEENGETPCSDTAVHQEFQHLLGHKTSSVRDPIESKTSVLSGYRGIRLKDPEENWAEDDIDWDNESDIMDDNPPDFVETDLLES